MKKTQRKRKTSRSQLKTPTKLPQLRMGENEMIFEGEVVSCWRDSEEWINLAFTFDSNVVTVAFLEEKIVFDELLQAAGAMIERSYKIPRHGTLGST